MRKLLTEKNLKKYPLLSDKDKELIEYCVKEHGGGYDESMDTPLRCAIRTFLVRSTEEMTLDGPLRKSFAQMSACFADGWQYAKEA